MTDPAADPRVDWGVLCACRGVAGDVPGRWRGRRHARITQRRHVGELEPELYVRAEGARVDHTAPTLHPRTQGVHTERLHSHTSNPCFLHAPSRWAVVPPFVAVDVLASHAPRRAQCG